MYRYHHFILHPHVPIPRFLSTLQYAELPSFRPHSGGFSRDPPGLQPRCAGGSQYRAVSIQRTPLSCRQHSQSASEGRFSAEDPNLRIVREAFGRRGH